MTSKESILRRLTEAVKGTDKELFSDEVLDSFASSHAPLLSDDTSGDAIAKLFVEFSYEQEHECRRCSVCGKLMDEGYCHDGGFGYYCSDECLHHDFTDEQWEQECDENDQSYWTQWY